MNLATMPEDTLEPLVAALLARAPRMSFMQLCRLLEARTPQAPGLGARDSLEHEVVRFGSRPRTGFPAGEISDVERDPERPQAPPVVRTTFMGLYGVDAAMPSCTIDDIVLREEGHEAVEAFLDQFNHRYATLLYRAWKKYRYAESFRPGGTDAHSRNLLCLAGFGWGNKPERAGLPDTRMLALLGLLIQKTRTPEGLAGVVAMTAPGVSVRVDEFFPVAIDVTPHPLTPSGEIAANPESETRRTLGNGGYVLGKRLIYRGRAVRVTISPENAQQAHDLLPGAWLHRDLMALMHLYVGVKADVYLRMELSSRLVPKPVLGQSATAPFLGWTAVLPTQEERAIVIELGSYKAFPMPAPNPHLH